MDFSATDQTSVEAVSDMGAVDSESHTEIAFGMPDKEDDFVGLNLDDEDANFVHGAKISVIGVGGGGCKAVGCMAQNEMQLVKLVAINTDIKALVNLKRKAGDCNNLKFMQLGPKATRGLGAGSLPENGAMAAQESEADIRKAIQGSDMVFITVGLGGGTGTGASPMVAQIAKDMGVLTVAVATLPFYSEGKRRWKTAIEGMEKLLKEVDSLILVPNQKINDVYGQQTVLDGYMHSDQVLIDAVQGISDVILNPGDFNSLDFADVRTCLQDKGLSVISIGHAKASPKCAQEALSMVLNNRMLEDCDISGAKGILGNIYGNRNLKTNDCDQIASAINALADDDAIIKVGTVIDESIEDGIRVVLVAAGISMRGLEVDAISQHLTPQGKTSRLKPAAATGENKKISEQEQERNKAEAKQGDSATGFRSVLSNPTRLGSVPIYSTKTQNNAGEDVTTTPKQPDPQEAANEPHSTTGAEEATPLQRTRTVRVVETREERIPGSKDNEDVDDKNYETPAYMRKPRYTNLGRFARLKPFQD